MWKVYNNENDNDEEAFGSGELKQLIEKLLTYNDDNAKTHFKLKLLE